ncbi:hypothetical protein EV356DRAFT_500965 [Viridothelium virens]|uniref:Uncharacterized protein n=1 Tax=Viridothelium virens TaxID=1048519 RepID=A0A6A6HBZ0_VIRVR|nr:hypothetical protein EV356DRAFT_500965 [Viridothelium virens]
MMSARTLSPGRRMAYGLPVCGIQCKIAVLAALDKSGAMLYGNMRVAVSSTLDGKKS